MLHLSGDDDNFLEEVDLHIQANLEDEEVKEALNEGRDLREYAKTVQEELREVENKSIDDYIREASNIASLHNQIVNCDQILEVQEHTMLRNLKLPYVPTQISANGKDAPDLPRRSRRHQRRNRSPPESIPENEHAT